VADFVGDPTSGPVSLQVSFTDLSTGNPDTWSWDFGDGIGTSNDQNPVYTYNDSGKYTVSLTVSNAYGSDNETKVDYITVTEVGNDMYVYDMVVGRTKVAAYYYGTCTVTIYDDQNNPVQGATVYVTATGPTGGDYNGVTAADGTVDFQTATGLKKPVGEWCYEVTNVTHATYTYNPALNNVTKACESGPVFKYSDAVIPVEFGIRNYPNPFNPATTLEMSLPVASEWQITIYNVVGQRIEEFSGYSEAGIISIEWDGNAHASGIYFYKAVAGEYADTEKMVLMK
jgi:PKD repeat protein